MAASWDLEPAAAAVPAPALKLLSAVGAALPLAAAAAAPALYRRRRSSLLLLAHALLLLGGLPQLLLAPLVARGWLPHAGAAAAAALAAAQPPRAALSWALVAWQAAPPLLQLLTAASVPHGLGLAAILQAAGVVLFAMVAWSSEMVDRCGRAAAAAECMGTGAGLAALHGAHARGRRGTSGRCLGPWPGRCA
jgi:hypothetical protein